GESVGSTGSEVALFAGVASGAVIFIIIIIALVALLHRRHQKQSAQCSAQLPLNTLPKRGSGASGGSNNNGSEPSDIIFPLRTSGSMSAVTTATLSISSKKCHRKILRTFTTKFDREWTTSRPAVFQIMDISVLMPLRRSAADGVAGC
ncbi:hypothetical protein M9458_002269, partial [Cirrhinus mrigala]